MNHRSCLNYAGVMRFLQTEWHRHERDRNAWEIEREEMKKRIAILEGESRTSKGLRSSLEKHVKILELALKRERERVKALGKGAATDVQKDTKELAKEELDSAKCRIYFTPACSMAYILSISTKRH